MARRPTSETPNYTSILDRNRDEIQPAGLIPSGVWLLRGLSAKAQKKVDEKTDEEYDIVTLIHEPVEPTGSVDPDEAGAVNEKTSRSTFDGKRVFTKFFVHNDADADRMLRVVEQHGVETEGRSVAAIFEAFKGARVYGEVYTRSFKNQGGENQQDNSIRGWCSEEDYVEQD